ncbi:GNAT family N-acetyltransferase [Pseudoalteromonas tunicata]|uniref:GNAT family N-acetyltransferase n=1 Tax=Pseudoalteromonas tunicata TaxID=314281 RepID=UPI00273F2AD7|nr:GNAT family N-acetyltransferase [Pseudoalteromonas tunicata]MDP4984142.1 GNAT family N-acetyltransferase [Pseudoalteromonas tunicata]
MIRLATLSDRVAVQALYQELRPHDPILSQEHAEKAWADLINDSSSFIVVAERDDQLAATCALTMNKSIANGARPFGIIEHVITAAKFRQQGLSQQVLTYAIELAWQQQCYKVMLLSGEQLIGAHRVYEKVGFKSGIEKGFVIKPPGSNDTKQ